MNPAAESQAFLQLAKLCQDHTAVGMKLLDKISSVPRGELSCSEYMANVLGGTSTVLHGASTGLKSEHREEEQCWWRHLLLLSSSVLNKQIQVHVQ